MNQHRQNGLESKIRFTILIIALFIVSDQAFAQKTGMRSNTPVGFKERIIYLGLAKNSSSCNLTSSASHYSSGSTTAGDTSVYNYDVNNNLVLKITRNQDGTNNNKIIYTYNSSNKEISEEYYYWNTSVGVYEKSSKYMYSYNGNGTINTLDYYFWDSPSQTYKLSGTAFYTVYDINNNCTQVFFKLYNASLGSYDNYDKTDITYNSFNKPTLQLESVWVTQLNNYRNYGKSTYTYNTNNDVLQEVGTQWDTITNTYVNSYVANYTYYASNDLKQVSFLGSWNSNTNTYDSQYTENYYYCANNNGVNPYGNVSLIDSSNTTYRPYTFSTGFKLISDNDAILRFDNIDDNTDWAYLKYNFQNNALTNTTLTKQNVGGPLPNPKYSLSTQRTCAFSSGYYYVYQYPKLYRVSPNGNTSVVFSSNVADIVSYSSGVYFTAPNGSGVDLYKLDNLSSTPALVTNNIPLHSFSGETFPADDRLVYVKQTSYPQVHFFAYHLFSNDAEQDCSSQFYTSAYQTSTFGIPSTSLGLGFTSGTIYGIINRNIIFAIDIEGTPATKIFAFNIDTEQMTYLLSFNNASPFPFNGSQQNFPISNGKMIIAVDTGAAGNSNRNLITFGTDGTSGGTNIIATYPYTTGVNTPLTGQHMTVVNNKLIWFVDFASHTSIVALDLSTGTFTNLCANNINVVNTGNGDYSAGYVNRTLSHNGCLYFKAYDQNGTGRRQLWKTDGTLAGTKQIIDMSYFDNDWDWDFVKNSLTEEAIIFGTKNHKTYVFKTDCDGGTLPVAGWVGIKQLPASKPGMKLYPTVNAGSFKIEAIGVELKNNQAEIIDCYGKTVKAFKVPDHNEIFFEDLNSGLYILKVNTVKGIYNTKFIIEK